MAFVRLLRSHVRLMPLFSMLIVAGCATGTQQRFQSHVDYLASDRLEGRGLGTEGIELAADYIADRFENAGLTPLGDDDTFFQTFEMTLRRELDPSSRLAFSGDDRRWRLGEDFVPFSFSSTETFSGEVIFCGYGIDAPEHDHHDFAHADLTGRVALIITGEPPDWTDEEGNPTRHAMLRNKVYNAKDRDASAVLIVSAMPPEGEADRLTPFSPEGGDAYGIPAFHITRAMADAQLARASLDALENLERRLNEGNHATAVLKGISCEGQAVFSEKKAPVRNVVALLPGTGALGDQYVLIGAHYDHLGVRRPFMRRFKQGRLVAEELAPAIHNGADDNASGTSALMEIARMFAQRPHVGRSILFVAFTAEETGLHGSTHFVEHPPVPLSNIVAMLNMDMVGRLDSDTRELTVFGVDTGTPFREIVESAAAQLVLKPAMTADAGARSDHAPFVRNDIPSMHFFTGHHAEYHKPGDDPHTINAAGGADVARLVYAVARRIAELPARPTHQEVKVRSSDSPAGTPTYRVVMGLAPGYVDDGKPGMPVEAVSPEGPADLAGMKAGDRIIRIDEKEVQNIYDYMAATRNNQPGDTVTVIVLRDGTEVELKVTLAAAR